MGNFRKKLVSSHQLIRESANADAAHPPLESFESSSNISYFGFRYVVERVLAFIILVPVIPIIFFLGCLVRTNSRGAAIYRQTRVGLHGQEFSMYKIRTMVIDAEGISGPAWCTESDPRITTIGKLLRFLHLDELPQLFNVALGQMSFIGPRPERPAFVKVLRQHVASYNDRLTVKPGITGLAQIYLPADQTLRCVRKKVKMDKAYIRTASPTVDLQIALCTLLRMVGLRNGKGPRWMGLDSRYHEAIEDCHSLDQHDAHPTSIADIRFDDAEDPAKECHMEPQILTPVLVGVNKGSANHEEQPTSRPNKPR